MTDQNPHIVKPEYVLEVWKKTVDVQQHFNDIELRIRNMAITIYGGFLGAIAFSIRFNHFTLIPWLCVASALVWGAFFLMDLFWYHRLLLGAVHYGTSLESTYPEIFPTPSLANRIGKESPVTLKLLKKHGEPKVIEVHSQHKFYVFYGLGALPLVFVMAWSFFH